MLGSPPTRQATSARKSGLLWKESRGVLGTLPGTLGASWKQYQFVVDDSCIYYFDAAEAVQYDLSLLLDRRGIEPLDGTMQLELTVVANTKSARGDRWAMRLNSEGRKWIDAGESQEESRQWAEALEQQLGVRNTYDPSRQGGGPDESGRSESSNRSTSQRGASNRLSSHRSPSLWMDSSRRESSERIGEPPSLNSLRNFFAGRKPAGRAPTSTLPPPTPPTSPERRDGPCRAVVHVDDAPRAVRPDAGAARAA